MILMYTVGEPGEDTISPFKEIDVFLCLKFFEVFHIGVFVVSGASTAVGGRHFQSGRAAGLCCEDCN